MIKEIITFLLFFYFWCVGVLRTMFKTLNGAMDRSSPGEFITFSPN